MSPLFHQHLPVSAALPDAAGVREMNQTHPSVGTFRGHGTCAGRGSVQPGPSSRGSFLGCGLWGGALEMMNRAFQTEGTRGDACQLGARVGAGRHATWQMAGPKVLESLTPAPPPLIPHFLLLPAPPGKAIACGEAHLPKENAKTRYMCC